MAVRLFLWLHVFVSYVLVGPAGRCGARTDGQTLIGLEPSGEQVGYRTATGPLLRFRVDKTLIFDPAIPVRFGVYLTLLNDRLLDRLRKAFRPVRFRVYLTLPHYRLPERKRRDVRERRGLLFCGQRQSSCNDGKR